MPSGVKSWLQSSGIPGDQVDEMVWWQQSELPDRKEETKEDQESKPLNGKEEKKEGELKTKIVFTPSNHWSKRTAFDDNHCLWGSWAVVGKKVTT